MPWDDTAQEPEPLLSICLNGNLRLIDNDGAEIVVTERRGQALLALLATSPDKKRSREWLKSMLWPRSYEPQSSYSLRSCVHKIRAALGPTSAALKSNRNHIWLENVATDPVEQSLATLFYEDAPLLNDKFVDWVETQRSMRSGDSSSAIPAPTGHRPCIVITPPVVMGVLNDQLPLAEIIVDQMSNSFRTQEFVDVFDLRDETSNQLANFRDRSPGRPDGVLNVRFQTNGSSQNVTVRLLDPGSGRVLWNSSLRADQFGPFALDFEQIIDFSQRAVDAIHTALSRGLCANSKKPSLFAAIHQLMTRSHEGHSAARAMLREFDQASGVARAWLAYSFVVASADRLGRYDREAVEEAEMHCRAAVEADPSNPIVRALVGHVHGFLLRDLETADEHHRVARQAGTNLSMVWHCSAMHLVYSGDPVGGLERAGRARDLGAFSPYKTIFDSSYLVSTALCGNHADAIRVGKSILARGPFLSVMRHLTGSLAHNGERDAARRMILDTRRVDPEFTPEGIRSPDYPLPATQSVKLIASGFRKAGF